ncbi:MAG: tRNA (guanosine(46)-N7)-methyltransferase TrmB [Lysobacterales bacterium]
MTKAQHDSEGETSVDDTATRRTVRSFVLRGRTTEAQEKALQDSWSTVGLTPKAGEWLHNLVPGDCPPIMEIGIGNGDALIAMAQMDQTTPFVGVEVHRPGVGAALIEIQRRNLSNVQLICQDACELLENNVAEASLGGVRLYFPDPWHKTRHHKRRIVQPDFVRQIARAMKPQSLFHLATDWQPYADHMVSVLEASSQFINVAGPGQPSPRPDWRIETRFERRGLRLGHEVTDLIYQRC